MSEEMQDFNNVLTLRNHLSVVPKDQLIEMYQDKGHYLTFLNAVVALSEMDSAFLLFSEEFLERINDVIQIHRFDFSEIEIKDCINDIIGYLNQVRAMSPTKVNLLKNGYLAYQEEQRSMVFHSTEEMIRSLAYDAVVFTSLREGNSDDIQDENHFLMSFNYLVKACPEFFQDPKIAADAIKVLDRVGRHSGKFSAKKKFVKQVRREFESILQKEE